jgi:ribosomal protein S18 acetylase RimI-like enzyme
MVIQALEKTDRRKTALVFEIQMSAYRREADILGVDSLPPLRESIGDIQDTHQQIFVSLEQDIPVGAIFLEQEGDSITISKLAVDPKHFRKGVGKALVEHCLMRHSGFAFKVSTGAKNLPAVRLYQSLGFVVREQFEADGGLMLIRLERPGTRVFFAGEGFGC